MPGKKTNWQGTGGQRYHKSRLGCMLVPHGRVSGLLFTVNPRQESKALRELQLYLHPLIADLEEAHKKVREHAVGKGRCDAATTTTTTEEQNPLKMSTDAEGKMAPTTSSLLAAELAEYVTTRGGQRRDEMRRIPMEEEKSDMSGEDDENKSTDNNNNNNNSDDGVHDTDAGRQSFARKRQRHDMEGSKRTVMNSLRWLAPLETGCKGHLMVSIPFAPLEQGENDEMETGAIIAETQIVKSETVEASTPPTASVDGAASRGDGRPPHSIVYNPLVHTVVERIFKDLEDNPRPLLRNCFRLMPCELTCCPTLPEMREALGQLVDAHFPPTEGPQRLHCVSLAFNVKNNTGVENKKSYYHAALETVFPVNRFVLIPAARLNGRDGEIEAVFCAFVAHATCAMGVQWLFSHRGRYNLHALSAKQLELSSSV
ncbi:hypothetical protein MOQ_003862 [Trypanosoma cruzi marinkellei]|uniref:Uncharacterized protein n=1 Tax=Trypanosoma cruzi marinkellei TaxID=85056 RepID=K2NBM5_TRYCR|nr:hypothetical protein MOQ_003862 [Trypanosoma cruzi marinkellei]